MFECWHADFGDCLFGAIARLFEKGHTAAIVLNSDGPTLPTSLLVEAANFLAQPGDRMVFGPAEDGGYYLLGIKSAHRRLFEDIAWSTEHVAQQTLARATEIGLPVHILAPWYDVDDIATLRRLFAELLEGAQSNAQLKPYQAQQTAKLLRRLSADDTFRNRIGIAGSPPVARVAP